MFIPNATVTIEKVSTKKNRFGEYEFLPAIQEPCALARIDVTDDHTAVRTDASASRANAKEHQSFSKILFKKDSIVGHEDRVTVGDIQLKVTKVSKRYNIFGLVDHIEADLMIWA